MPNLRAARQEPAGYLRGCFIQDFVELFFGLRGPLVPVLPFDFFLAISNVLFIAGASIRTIEVFAATAGTAFFGGFANTKPRGSSKSRRVRALIFISQQ